MNYDNLVKVYFDFTEDTWHQIPSESVWAEKSSEGNLCFTIMNTPFLAKGINYLDVIKVEEKKGDHGYFVFSKVIKRSGHSTYRIIVDYEHSKFLNYWKTLEKLGCTYESAPYETSAGSKTLYAIDVKNTSDVKKVYSFLEKCENDGIWIFEEGHCGHSLCQ